MASDEQRDDEPHLSRIVVTIRNRRWLGGTFLDVEYHLRPRASLPTVFVDHEIEPVHVTAVPRGVRVDSGHDGDTVRLQLTWGVHPAPSEVVVKMRMRWGPPSPSRLHGSSVCVIPAYLPELVTAHARYFRTEQNNIPVTSALLPRIEVRPSLAECAGAVSDETGALLMAAWPTGALATKVVHTDDAFVLAGAGFEAVDGETREGFTARLHEIHDFLDQQFGRGANVRVLVVAEVDANAHTGGKGQFLAIEKEWIVRDSSNDGGFIDEQIFVRQMASIWWTFGVSLVGAMGQNITEGIAIYASLRWLQVTGREDDLSMNLRRWRGYLDQVAIDGIESNPFIWYSVNMGLGLFEHSASASPVLKAFCDEYWGVAVPVTTLTERLASAIALGF